MTAREQFYDNSCACLYAEHPGLLTLITLDPRLGGTRQPNVGPAHNGFAMASAQQLGITDLYLADPLIAARAEASGDTPAAASIRMALEQWRQLRPQPLRPAQPPGRHRAVVARPVRPGPAARASARQQPRPDQPSTGTDQLPQRQRQRPRQLRRRRRCDVKRGISCHMGPVRARVRIRSVHRLVQAATRAAEPGFC